MKTAEEKYMHDPHFHSLVETLLHHIHAGDFTPSELREAVVFAATHYESTRIRTRVIPVDVAKALDTLHDFNTLYGKDETP